jgi:two-component system sensor histidine kinase PilS (NtrC family)
MDQGGERAERQPIERPVAAPDRLRTRVTAYMFIRLVLVTILFGIAIWTVLTVPQSLLSLGGIFVLAGLTFLFMGLSAALVRRWGNRRGFVLTQLLFDALLITLLVKMTGGRHSIAHVFYIVNIAGAAYLVPQRLAGIVVVGANAVAFAATTVLDALYFSPEATAAGVIYVDVLMRMLGFVVIGFLTNRLAVRTQQADAALLRQQETTRVLEEEHGLIVQSVLSGILAVDPGGIIRSANPAALARLGTCEGRPLSAVMPGLRRYKDGQEIVVWGPEHSLTLLCYRSPLGDVGGEVVVFEDVTELRRYEADRKREERLAGVGRVAAGIAHEIRNPLASLSGVLQLLAEEHEGPLLEIAQRETLRLNELVSDFLESARPIELRRQPLHVHALLDEVVAAFNRDPRYGELVHIVVDEEGDDEAELDPARLRQIFWNLLLNAAQAMPEGGLINIAIRALDDLIVIEVQDQGSGIAAEDLPKVFDPFYTTRQGGTGLGLANVDRLVRLHNGRVSVRSVVGEGTSFVLEFPRRSAAPAPVQVSVPGEES